MKNSIKSFVCALAFVAAGFTVQAEDKDSKKATGFGSAIYPTKAGKINVLVDKADSEATTVLLLKNEKGETLYREVVGKNHKKFGRALNVDDLEAGKYQLNVISNGETQTKAFELSQLKTQRSLSVN